MLRHWLDAAQKACGLDLKAETALEVLGLQLTAPLAAHCLSKGDMSSSPPCHGGLAMIFNLSLKALGRFPTEYYTHVNSFNAMYFI